MQADTLVLKTFLYSICLIVDFLNNLLNKSKVEVLIIQIQYV